jgi:hypothetical protein
MIPNNFLDPLTFTFWVSSLQRGVHDFWRRITVFVRNALDGNAPERRMRSPAKGDRAAVGNAATAFHGAPHPAAGAHLPWEGIAPPCAVAPFRVVAPCPAPKNRTPHSVQLPDLELSDVGQGMFQLYFFDISIMFHSGPNTQK